MYDLLLCLVTLSLVTTKGVGKPAGVSNQIVQQCPAAVEIDPCTCSVKKNGLDVLCEVTDLQHINKAMTVIKSKPSLIIFYLKLRHNNLPKLQGFMFLGMDIRHLTIHNSSLAVVEEASLSSIGEYLLILFIHRIPKFLICIKYLWFAFINTITSYYSYSCRKR